MSAGTHVVFGTGPGGRAAADTLSSQGTADADTDVTALERPMLGALGLFNRNVRELLYTYYQFAAPFVVDDPAFRHALGGHPTPWGDIVATTVEGYRAHVTQPDFPAGLAEATTLEVAA